MIKGKVVTNLAELTASFPKFLVSEGDFEQTTVIETQEELDSAVMPRGSFVVEPLLSAEAIPQNNTYTVYGVDTQGESFLIQVAVPLEENPSQ